MHRRIVPRRFWIYIVGAVVLTLIAVLLAVNLLGGETRIERRLERHYSVDHPQFVRDLGFLLGPQVIGGNRYRALLNGDEIFPAMLAAIRSAKESITFETYIYWSGDIGLAFAEALAERARAGVRTHLLLDWLGSVKMDEALVERMKQAGVQVQRFHPPHWTHLSRLNNRTHRKILVFQVEGPVVAQMQAVFLDNWIKASGEVLHGERYFPVLRAVGDGPAQMFSSSPTGGSESMQLMYLLAITSAAKSIDLSASYFVPDDLSRAALLEAVKRGVRLRIVVPGEHIDSDTVRHASRATWGPLLAAGAEIAEYGPTMFHCKVMIVDGLLVSVGSTNFDNRSFRLNDEATLNIVDAGFAREQTATFEADLARSRRVTFAEWNERPLKERLMERLASIFDSQL
jgi:cardiolipin synthase